MLIPPRVYNHRAEGKWMEEARGGKNRGWKREKRTLLPPGGGNSFNFYRVRGRVHHRRGVCISRINVNNKDRKRINAPRFPTLCIFPRFRDLSPIHLPGEIYIYTHVGWEDKVETRGKEKGTRYIRTTRSRISISVYRLNETN